LEVKTVEIAPPFDLIVVSERKLLSSYRLRGGERQ